MRKIEIDLSEILDLIMCAEHLSGWNNHHLMSSFAKIIGYSLTDEEINEFVKRYSEFEGYTKDDREEAAERLNKFRIEYIQNRIFTGIKQQTIEG